MKLVVGLGNPGPKHENNRHNIGFMVIDEVARKLMPSEFKFEKNSKFKAEILKLKNDKEAVILAKPLTFMNASGYAVEKILRFYGIEVLGDLWIVHDDLDLPLGKLKIVQGRGPGGHHGVESIVARICSDHFVRFRVGIGHPTKDGKWDVGGGKLVTEKADRREVENYVLKDFVGKDAVEARKMIKKTSEAMEYALQTSLNQAMERFNAK